MRWRGSHILAGAARYSVDKCQTLLRKLSFLHYIPKKTDFQLFSLCSPPSCWILESEREKSVPLTFRQGLWLVMSYGPYMKLVIGFLFTSLAFMVMLCLIFLVLL